MSHVADPAEMGYLPLQDHRTNVGQIANKPDVKTMVWCCRVRPQAKGDHLRPIHTEDLLGPLQGGYYWPPETFSEHPPFWFFAAPTQVFSDGPPRLAPAPGLTGFPPALQLISVTRGGPQGPQLRTRPITGDYALGGTVYNGLGFLPAGQEPTYPFGERYPGFSPATVLNGASPSEQKLTAMPAFVGIFAPYAAGAADLGSNFYDIDDKDQLDFTRRARAQSLVRTYRNFPDVPSGSMRFGRDFEPAGIALQMGTARGGRSSAPEGPYGGNLLFCDDEVSILASPIGDGTTEVTAQGVINKAIGIGTVERTPGGQSSSSGPGSGPKTTSRGQYDQQLFGAGTARGGGPLHVGAVDDKHFHVENNVGERLNPLHFTTESLFIHPDNERDAPLEFGGAWVPPSHGPLLVFTYLRYDIKSQHLNSGRLFNGLWRWETETFFGIIVDPPPKKRKPKPPPDGFPPPDGVPPPDGPRIPGEPKDGVVGPGGFIVPNPGGNPFQSGPGQGSDEKFFTGFAPKGLSLAGSPNEIAFGSMVVRANNFQAGQPDLRNRFGPLTQVEVEAWRDQPAIGRWEGAGNQAGPTFTRTTRDAGRYDKIGSSNGALWFMPPEMGLERLSVPGTVSTTYLGMWNARNAWGTPLLTGANAGGVASGFSTGLFSSTQLNADYHNSSGVRTVVLTLSSAGTLGAVSMTSTAESVFDSVAIESIYSQRVKNVTGSTITAPTVVKATGYDTGDGVVTVSALTSVRDVPLGILIVDLTNNSLGSAARNGATIISGLNTSASFIGAPVFSSGSGTLSLAVGSRRVGFVLDLANPGRIIVDIAPHVELKTEGQTASFTAAGGASYDINTGGGAVTVTLPEITQLMDGTKIVLTDTGNAATNNITVSRTGAVDTILGAASATMITNYASVTLIARYSAGASVWQVT